MEADFQDDVGLQESSQVEAHGLHEGSQGEGLGLHEISQVQVPVEAAQDEEAGPHKEMFDVLREAVKDFISEGLLHFNGATLARFRWNLADGEKGEFVIRGIVKDDSKNHPSLTLECRYNDQEVGKFLVPSWTITHTNEKISLQYKISGLSPFNDIYSYTDFEESSGIQHYTNEIVKEYRTRGIVEHTEFARLWFGDNKFAPEALIHQVTRLNREPVLHEYLQDIGPIFEDDRWKFKHPSIAIDISDTGYLVSGDPELKRKLAGIFVGNAVWRIILLTYAGDDRLTFKKEFDFPGPSSYALRRPVDLESNVVLRKLKADGFEFPWHVIDAACTSLNSGKNVIFTGPPGCGKTKLAVELSKIANGGELPVFATASPAWANDELIGRYLPSVDGSGLVFEPGFFLKAVENGQWLIIDELNRADIDQAFGELFSVLAGDIVELPYRYVAESIGDEFEGESSGDQGRRIRIIPHNRATNIRTDGEKAQFKNFHVAQDFRLLGTMNDADRSSLHQLSFAFRRRFNIIRVEAPKSDIVERLIISKVASIANEYGLTSEASRQVDYRYQIYVHEGKRATGSVELSESDKDILIGKLIELCARKIKCEKTNTTGSEKDGSSEAKNNTSDQNQADKEEFKDLVSERIIGIATVLDMIAFVAEGLRAPTDGLSNNNNRSSRRSLYLPEKDEANGRQAAGELIQSFLAMAIVLSVFPQLDAYSDNIDMLRGPVHHIMKQFRDDKDKLTTFRKIEFVGDGKNERYLLEDNGKINDFLAKELALQLGAVGRDFFEQLWLGLIKEGLITRRPDRI